MTAVVLAEEMVCYTLVELLCVQRHLRLQREALTRDRIAMEERIKGGHDVDLATAHRVIDTEIDILDGAIKKNWEVINRRMRPPPQPP